MSDTKFMKSAELIIDTPSRNPDLYYATGFLAPDSFVYLKTGAKKYLMMSDLEIDRAKVEARVDAVLSLSHYFNEVRKKKTSVTRLDAVILFLKEKGIRELFVPDSMPCRYVDELREKKFKVVWRPRPFYSRRLKKTRQELGFIRASQKAAFSAMKLAETMLHESTIKKKKLLLDGKPLTSERMQKAVAKHLLEKGFTVPEGPIVSCGRQAFEPHNMGSGPLEPHKTIIVDIFPKSAETLFFGDTTRTFCKGKAPYELKKMYEAVASAQALAFGMIRAGVNGRAIHNAVVRFFAEAGFKTGDINGKIQGFIHGVGHGIGLEIHEEPVRIGLQDYVLQEGFVTSIEPGLYYEHLGGVRIEDLVLVTKKGCKILESYPRKFEIP